METSQGREVKRAVIGAHAGSRQSTGAAFAGCVIPRALSSVYRPGVEVSVPAERRSAGAGMCGAVVAVH